MPRLLDVHLHAIPQSYRAALYEALGAAARTPPWTPDLSIEMMDRRGIAAAILSLSAPGPHLGDDAKAVALARICNDEAAGWVARHRRLGAFAALPLPNVEGACDEAIRALDKLKLDGVGLLTSYEGAYLGDSRFDPLLRVLDYRAAVVLVHPGRHPSHGHIALGVPDFMLEYPFETTRAAVSMVFADVLDRFPRIRFILSHGGGTLPFLAWRVATIAMRQLSQPPDNERFLRDRHPTALTLRHEVVTAVMVIDLMRRFWFDVALTADRPGLGALLAFADPERILFGSDWPYAYETVIEDQMRSLTDPQIVPARDADRIARENAVSLFPRLAPVWGDDGVSR